MKQPRVILDRGAVKIELIRKNLLVKQIAERLEVTPCAVSIWLRGKSCYLKNAKKIAAILEVPVDSIIMGTRS